MLGLEVGEDGGIEGVEVTEEVVGHGGGREGRQIGKVLTGGGGEEERLAGDGGKEGADGHVLEGRGGGSGGWEGGRGGGVAAHAATDRGGEQAA